MARNFKISVHRNSDCLHIKLSGDFDGASAHQVINLLQKNSRGASKVFIHTNCLKHVHPFGRNIFLTHLGELQRRSIMLAFTGEHSQQLAPEGTRTY